MLSLAQVRDWYPDHDPVHGFDHVERVYHLALKIGAAEGADLEIVAAAALLHDVGRLGSDGQPARDHHLASAVYAARVLAEEGWPPERNEAVLHAIRSHRYRDQREAPATPEARALFDADKLDAIGAIGIARAIANAAQMGAPIYASPSPQFLATGVKAPGERHSAYHEYLFKLRKIKDRLLTPTGRALAEERTRFMADYFNRLQEEVGGEA